MQYFQKLIQKDHGFTHNLVENVSSHDRADIWSLHRGTAKDGGEPSLVFHFDPAKAASNLTQKQALAKTAHTRLKTLRHPDVLKYLTSVEASDGTIYIATEPAIPLATIMAESPNKLDRDTIQWGLFTVARALGFMHSSGLIHGRLNTSTVFVTPTGDWKLAGLECVTPHASAASLSQHATSLQSPAYQSPEFSHSNWASVASAAPSAVDSWALGCLMYETHAGSLSSAENLKNISAMPKPLHSAYQKLLGSNPTMRAPAGELPNHPYFKNSKFVELNLFVENLALKGQLEQEAFLSKLPNTMDRLPDGFCTFKVLPMLSQNIASGNGGAAAFACIVKMKDRLKPADFSAHVVNKYALSWFGNQSMDRNLKAELLSKLELFMPHLDDAAINATIFPAVCNAFQDMQSPALRDSAVKSVLLVVDRLTDKNLNNVLMSHFARLQVDPEPAIRTNTTVCLGKISTKLSAMARTKVLAAAFVRALKDPFPPARAAGVNAILITSETYDVKEMATRLLPAIVPLLVDGSSEVRTIAFRVLDSFKGKMMEHHNQLLRTESQTPTAASNGTANGSVGPSGPGGASGWGLSSFTSMTAALLNKSDSAASNTASSAGAMGISSEDFRRGGAQGGGNESLGREKETKPTPIMDNSSNVSSSSSYWGAPNSGTNANQGGLGQSNVGHVEPAQDVYSGGLNNSANLLDTTSFENEDDGDGWGDMDLKTDQAQDEDEALSAMVGTSQTSDIFGRAPSAHAQKSVNVQSSAKKSEPTQNLWDLGPTQVSRPKPRTAATAGTGQTFRAGAGRKTRTGGDDWEALLGGSSSGARRKTTGRNNRAG